MNDAYAECVREFVKRRQLSGLELEEFSTRGQMELPIVDGEINFQIPRLFDSLASLRIVNMPLYQNNVVGSYIISVNANEFYSGQLAAGICIPLKLNLVPMYETMDVVFRFTEAEIVQKTLVVEYIGTVVSEKIRTGLYHQTRFLKNAVIYTPERKSI